MPLISTRGAMSAQGFGQFVQRVKHTYAVLDAASKNSSFALSNGGLTATNNSGTVTGGVRADTSKSAGSWYWEVNIVSGASGLPICGVYSTSSTPASQNLGFQAGEAGYLSDGRIFVAGTNVTTVAAFVDGDLLGFALDMTAKTLAFYRNGTLVYTTAGSSIGTAVYPGVGRNGVMTCNFGASAFSYAVPSGFNYGVYV